MRSSSTRADLLQAALLILERDGVKHLTIDAVAREAGVSKGGVLYHFPTKAELVRAMVLDQLDDLTARLDRLIEAESPGPGRVLRAFLQLHAEKPPLQAEGHIDMLSQISRDPELRGLIHDHRNAIQERLEHDGLDPTLAGLLAFAAEGLWCAEIFGPMPLDAETKQRILDLARRLTQPGALAIPSSVD